MPRLAISVHEKYAASRSEGPVNPYGRQIRRVNAKAGVNAKGARPLLAHPLFLKLMGGLAILAALTIAIAVWRLLHFAR
jgi:hypothetical protein